MSSTEFTPKYGTIKFQKKIYKLIVFKSTYIFTFLGGTCIVVPMAHGLWIGVAEVCYRIKDMKTYEII